MGQQIFKKLKKLKPSSLDSLFLNAHNEVFSKIDCLECANCCKTTSPLFLPHTNQRKMNSILDLTKKNAEICPAVVKILDIIEHNIE